MTQRRNSTATPKRRFPEFRQADGWQVTLLGDLIALEYGESLPEDSRVAGPIPVMGSNGVVGYHAQALVKGPAIIVGRKGSVGQLTWVASDCFPIDTTFYVRNKQPRKNSTQFLYRLLQLSKLDRRGDSGAVPGLNRNQVHALPTAIPKLEEQEKIAECFTSLDELITAHRNKVQALMDHKRSLLQRLWPRVGESYPRLRFPEFHGAPDWSTVPLGELLEGKPEYGVNAPGVPYSPKLPTYLRITDINENGRFIAERKASVDIDPTNDNYMSDGDIALARTGASVGKSYRYRRDDGPLVFAGFLIRIRPDQNRVLPEFLSGFLTSERYWRWIRLTSTRSGQPGVNGTEYAALPIPIPPPSTLKDKLAEQRRIGDCLSALDTHIAAVSDGIEALEAHRQGLLQQLFPLGAEHL